MPTSHFLIGGLTIVLIDLLLASDNALVIAMAVRSLPKRERRIASACGAALAVILRIALTAVAAQILNIEYLQLAGGLFILWIAVRVLIDASEPAAAARVAPGLMKAVWYVLIADLTMSVDNILAIAGASEGHLGLIVFGLALSIPFVVFSSGLLADLMNRYPKTLYAGAAILGKVGGDMALSDPFVMRTLHPSTALRYGVDAALIVAVLLAGRLLAKSRVIE